MKRLQFVLTLMIMAAAFSSCSSTGWMSEDSYEDESYYGRRSNVNMDMFMRELSPFGRWVTMPRYGQVWITNERGFRPYYSGGHWSNTRYGYTWVSDYSWGWAPFHYGQWGYDQFYGWFWVPGYEWSPAWVNWRNNGSYYGWSPYMVNGSNDYNNWIFLDQRYMNDRNMRSRFMLGDQYQDIYRNSQPVDRPRPNITTYRQQQQRNDDAYQNDLWRNRDRRIFRDELPNTGGGIPRRDVIERPNRIERPDMNKVERLDRPTEIQQRQQPVQRPASEIIRQNERREFKSEMPPRERPVEHIKREN